MSNKKLIPRCYYGTNRGGLVHRDRITPGTWGNRGQGNELESALERGLSAVGKGAMWLLQLPDHIQDGTNWLLGAIPGGPTSEQLVHNGRAKREAGSGGQWVDYQGNVHVNPEYADIPLLWAASPGGATKVASNYDDLWKAVQQTTKYPTMDNADDILRFRRAINSDDRFMAGTFLKEKLDKSDEFLDYIGHGIAKGTEADQFTTARTILRYGTNPNKDFYQAPLRSQKAFGMAGNAGLGTASGTPYYDGAFVLVSNKNNPNKFTHIFINDSFENELGSKLAKQYQQILQKEFPNVKALLYSEIK